MREINREISPKKTKLVKTTIFSLLVAAIMIGSAVTGVTMNMNEKTTEELGELKYNQVGALGTGENQLGEEPSEPEIITEIGKEIPYFGRIKSQVVWDNGMSYHSMGSSQDDSAYPFLSEMADDFKFDYDQGIQDVHWVGGFYNGDPAPFDWIIRFYKDAADAPGALHGGPFEFAWDDIDKIDLGGGYFEMGVDLPVTVNFDAGVKYWMSIQGVGIFPPQSGWAMHYGIQLSMGMFKSDFFGYPDWTDADIVGWGIVDFCFQLTFKPEHDVGVTEIKHPTHMDSPGCPCIPVEVEVTNFGANDEFDVPVHVEIHQNFWTTSFPYDDYIMEWNIEGNCPWQFVEDETAWPFVVEPFDGDWMAEFNQHGCTSGYGELITHYPTDLSGPCVDPYLKFYMWHDDYGSDDFIDVWVSTTGKYGVYEQIGGPYERLCCPECPIGWVEHRIDLKGTIAEGAPAVWFKFVGHCDGTPSAYNLHIDFVSVFDLQYDETEYIDIDTGEVQQVEFPCWPGECWWCQYENQEVLFYVGAWTEMEGDENRDNDGFGPQQNEFLPVWIYIPYAHDVGDKEISKPEDDYYMAQPIEMCQIIKNYGKNPEGCFNVYMTVQEEVVIPPIIFLEEDFEDSWPPSGWSTSNIGPSGTVYIDTWNTNQYYGRPNYPGSGKCADADSDNMYPPFFGGCGGCLYTAPINLVGETFALLEFDASYNYLYGTEYAAVDISINGQAGPWTNLLYWNSDHSPYGPGEHVVLDLSLYCGNPNVVIRFVYEDFFGWKWWFEVDNVFVWVPGYSFWGDIVYEEKVCVDDIQVCEEIEVCFPDWIPEPPDPCYCGTVRYRISSYTKMLDPPDENILNDKKTKIIEIEFLHDVGIKEFTSPAYIGKDVLWDNGPDNGANGLSCMWWPSYPLDREVVDDFFNTETWTVTDGHFSGTTYYCSGPGDVNEVRIFFYEDEGGIPSMARYAERLATSVVVTASGCELSYDVEFDPVVLPAGTWWVCFQPEFEDNGFWNTADGQGNAVYVSYPDAGFPKWTDGSVVFGVAYDVSFQLTGTIGGDEEVPPPDVYVPCGEQEFCVMIENLGTYDEDVTVVWTFYEYTPDKEVIDSGSVDLSIDSLTEEEVCLMTYDFTEEGVYEIEVEVLSPPDCNLDNNGPEALVIGVDCCGPESCFTMDPEEPNGENNWFVSAVTITAYAWDTCEIQSGIQKIVYIIDGVEDFIAGEHGEFVISGDGVHFCEIYAIDNVGNEEIEHHTFEVAIDATDPTVDLQHEEYQDEAGTWFVHFTAIANDVTSGMDRVEFKLDGALQETDDTSPFEWTIEWDPDYKTSTFTAVAFDGAGNSASDDVDGNDIPIGGSKPKDYQQDQSKDLSRTLLRQIPRNR